MKTTFIFSLFLLISIIASWYFIPASHEIVKGILGGLALSGIVFLYRHKDNISIIYEYFRYWNTDIRISFAYLFRIKINGKYLLVYNKNRRVYQPVGGAYQFHKETRPFLENELNCRDDIYQQNEENNSSDIRLLIKGRHLPSLMKWFNNGKGREWDVWREFYEELVEPGTLKAPPFGSVRTSFVRRELPPLDSKDKTRPPNRRLADIYEIIPDEDQLAVLRSLYPDSKPDPDGLIPICWATLDDIKEEGMPAGGPRIKSISDNARLILGNT